MNEFGNRNKRYVRTGSAGRSAFQGASGSSRGTGSTRNSADRISAVQRARRNGQKRRKPPFDYTKVALAVIGIVVIVLLCVATGKAFTKKAQRTGAVETETALKKEVQVDGLSLTGLSRNEAREKLLTHVNWGMKITYEGEEYSLTNLMETKVDELLESIYTEDPAESYTLDTDGLEDAVLEEAAAAAKQWDQPALNGAISSFDAQTGKFTFTAEKSGKAIKQDALAAGINQALKSREFQASIEAESEETQPEITEAQAREKYKTLGTFTTKTTSNKDRNTNIELACQALNGLIIQPGEEFSFNNTTGNRTTDKGYKAAGAYVNGVLVEEPGGGVCQVSSTLYNAVVFSGLKTTERHAHSYEPSYVTPGEDAMVSYDGYAGPDMKFINNSKDAVGIVTSFAKQKLTISIYGIPILEDGVTLEMHSEKTAEYDPPVPTYEEDQTLQLDEEKVVKQPVNGSKWVTNLITKKSGEVISDEFLHNSTYKGKAATIRRNTSGVVIPAPTESVPAESQTAPAETVPEETAKETASNGQNPGGPGVPETTKAPEATKAPETTAAAVPTESAPAQPQQNLIDPSPQTGN